MVRLKMPNLTVANPTANTSGAVNVGRAAEFFAGIGLVRMALERAGWSVEYANDIKPFKREMYRENFGGGSFDLRDVREVMGSDIPNVDLATASFPCMDLSLAGKRRGLAGDHSSVFWEFSRIIREMDGRRPAFLLIENVASFVTSKCGQDLRAAVLKLNSLGYECDLIITDAKWYVPQSRKRLFIVGRLSKSSSGSLKWPESPLRPPSLTRFIEEHPDLLLSPLPSPPIPTKGVSSLKSVIERLDKTDERWWGPEKISRFLTSLSDRNGEKLSEMMKGSSHVWATAYRRTRSGRSRWEIRSDGIAGCLRTSSGGSSKQALVETSCGQVRVRWMTPLEYARLQGADEYRVPESISNNQALFGFGDAVCVPALEWIIREYLNPVVVSTTPERQRTDAFPNRSGEHG